MTQTTVFVGPNSCGKTTALHAVQLACAALHFAAERRDGRAEADGWLTLHRDRPLRDDQSFLVPETPLRPNLLLPPALFPAEIRKVLDFMTDMARAHSPAPRAVPH